MNKKTLLAGSVLTGVGAFLIVLRVFLFSISVGAWKLDFNLVALLFAIAALILAIVVIVQREKATDEKLVKFVAAYTALSTISFAFEILGAPKYSAELGLVFALFTFLSGILCFIGIFINNRKIKGQIINGALSSSILMTVIILYLVYFSGFMFLEYNFIFLLSRLVLIAAAIVLIVLMHKYSKTTVKSGSAKRATESANSAKVNKIKEYQEKYGMSLMEAKEAVDADERAEKAKQAQGLVQDSNQGTNVQNQGNMSGITITPVSKDNPLPQTCGLGLDMSAFEQPQKTPSSEDVADLKRQLLQGKITRAEFDEKMAELKK